ncbi:hypothetical protein PFUGPA_03112 [Plasmodium falciparum Palo Alto/Uganda]|uniref:Uncharacterized protein n=1 Tax=Plasmodium falciparum (isolate Palo Alto / Uganda) TaxID=57270 RepID=W4IXI6_PLAFP|nr:hypothetical protein PFUGPA_03112 [Plasmodium falciparum Palo Alto/Uganda]
MYILCVHTYIRMYVYFSYFFHLLHFFLYIFYIFIRIFIELCTKQYKIIYIYILFLVVFLYSGFPSSREKRNQIINIKQLNDYIYIYIYN